LKGEVEGERFNYLENIIHHTTTTTTVLRPFFRDRPGEPVPEENFWTLWCKGRLTKADTPTIRLGATPSKLTSAHLHHPQTSLTTPKFKAIAPNMLSISPVKNYFFVLTSEDQTAEPTVTLFDLQDLVNQWSLYS